MTKYDGEELRARLYMHANEDGAAMRKHRTARCRHGAGAKRAVIYRECNSLFILSHASRRCRQLSRADNYASRR